MKNKGLDDDQLDELRKQIRDCLAEHCHEQQEEEQLIYIIYEDFRTILSRQNDSLHGRCSICLEKFCEDEAMLEQEKFTDRQDLARIDNCFHRFHLICVYRDWFMQRKAELDQFGVKIEFPLPEEKKCPICRNLVSAEDLEDIKGKYEAL